MEEDSAKILSGSNRDLGQTFISGSFQDDERGFYQDFIRFSSGSRSNLHIRILSGVMTTSDEDLDRKITRSVRIRN